MRWQHQFRCHAQQETNGTSNYVFRWWFNELCALQTVQESIFHRNTWKCHVPLDVGEGRKTGFVWSNDPQTLRRHSLHWCTPSKAEWVCGPPDFVSQVWSQDEFGSTKPLCDSEALAMESKWRDSYWSSSKNRTLFRRKRSVITNPCWLSTGIATQWLVKSTLQLEGSVVTFLGLLHSKALAPVTQVRLNPHPCTVWSIVEHDSENKPVMIDYRVCKLRPTEKLKHECLTLPPACSLKQNTEVAMPISQ